MSKWGVNVAGRSLYQILQVDPRAEPEVIEGAYRRLALKYHPDVSVAAGAEQRMKEITAAYAVLGDAIQRAAYDRELSVRDATPGTARPATAREGGQVCKLHPSDPAAGHCVRCGAALCNQCLEHFQPPTCARCVLTWARRRRFELLTPVVWFFVAITFVGVLVASFLADPGPRPSGPPLRAILVVTYVVASVPCGWRLSSAPVPALLGAAVVGPLIAPFRIAKIVSWDIRQVGRLAALAKRTERGERRA